MVSFENSIAKQGADIIIVPREAEAYPYPDVAAFVGSFSEQLLEEIEQLENVKATYPVLTAIPMDFMPEKPGAMPLIYGVTPAYFTEVVPHLDLAQGIVRSCGGQPDSVEEHKQHAAPHTPLLCSQRQAL